MHPGVSPSRDHKRHTLQSQNHAESALNLFLNSPLVGLASPAREVGAVVLEVQAGR
jgi:hypothetical protein